MSARKAKAEPAAVPTLEQIRNRLDSRSLALKRHSNALNVMMVALATGEDGIAEDVSQMLDEQVALVLGEEIRELDKLIAELPDPFAVQEVQP